MTAAPYIHTLILNCIYDALIHSVHSMDRKTCNADRRVVQSPEILLQVVSNIENDVYVCIDRKSDKLYFMD